jgi:hypothetical protein
MNATIKRPKPFQSKADDLIDDMMAISASARVPSPHERE